jgi:alcohol dehydrogenase, propanol-preferring
MEAWAVVKHDEPLQKIRLPVPDLVGTQVLLRVSHSGICHTDLHLWEGYYDLGGGQRLTMADRGIALPRVMGHEVLGTVEKLGPSVEGLEMGARRIVFPWLGCGHCRSCEKGDENYCNKPESIGILQDGGMAEFIVVRHSKYLVDPGNIDPAVACTYGCSGTTILNAVEKLGSLASDQTVVVIGAGGLGLSAISILRAMSHQNIVSVDVRSTSRQAALAAGARAAIDSSASDAQDRLLAATGGTVSFILDCVNDSGTVAFAWSILAKGGRMVQVGLMGGEFKLSLVALVARSAAIMGSTTGNVGHLKKLVQLANDGLLQPLPVTVMERDHAQEALTLLKEGKVTGRLVLAKRR